ncbi:hypothetical protein PDJAM_G00226120 [Pangasius djambal]|uniref:Uncharacterized protein n=1 Tax=Pangasius djambal TaxID=1691987 RepID=A0ACC5YDC1_9TELE|nr:hypothetical protein [Pangasius djambal]
MPGKLKAKIMAGRHLPVMDRASDLTDAFVEVKFGNTTFKTDVCPKSLNPQWNSEWFKFEVKPIWSLSIRGEINVLVKVDLFNDLNRFRQSSCGVKFFCTTSVPRCYRAVMVHGFVEELVVNEDPEYQWIDRIRTPRASNEARQRLISLMSGELQRKIGLKVLEMGGNAVVGYLQCFDLEGESGLVVRAIGTACTLDKISNTHASTGGTNPSNSSPSKDIKEAVFGEEAPGVPFCSGPPTPLRAQTFSSFSPSKSYSRQSSSSDTELSLTPKTARICLSPSSPILQSKSSPIPTTKAPRSTTPPPLHVSQSDTAMLRKSVSFSEDLLLAASARICLSPSSPILQSKSSPIPTTKAPRSTTPPPLHVSQSDTAMLRKSVSFSEDLLLAASGRTHPLPVGLRLHRTHATWPPLINPLTENAVAVWGN